MIPPRGPRNTSASGAALGIAQGGLGLGMQWHPGFALLGLHGGGAAPLVEVVPDVNPLVGVLRPLVRGRLRVPTRCPAPLPRDGAVVTADILPPAQLDG